LESLRRVVNMASLKDCAQGLKDFKKELKESGTFPRDGGVDDLHELSPEEQQKFKGITMKIREALMNELLGLTFNL